MGRRNRYPEPEYKLFPVETYEECCACDKPATQQAVIRWGPMRGTDIDSSPVCQRHARMYEDNFDRFMAHMCTKDKFLKRDQEAS